MASAAQKIKLSPSRDIPFNKLVLSQSSGVEILAKVLKHYAIERIAEREAA
jgi:ParB family chromosome partitioning protein